MNCCGMSVIFRLRGRFFSPCAFFPLRADGMGHGDKDCAPGEETEDAAGAISGGRMVPAECSIGRLTRRRLLRFLRFPAYDALRMILLVAARSFADGSDVEAVFRGVFLFESPHFLHQRFLAGFS